MPDRNKLHYVVATAIVIKDGKFLIAKRASWEKAFPNEWTVPGGKLELNDYIKLPKTGKNQWYNITQILFPSVIPCSLGQGCKLFSTRKEIPWAKAHGVSLEREVKEEVGLRIKNIKYLCDLVFIRPDKIPVVTLSFYANWAGGKVKLAKDLTEFAWVTVKEAKKYPLIEGIYDELVMLDKVLKGKKVLRWRPQRNLNELKRAGKSQL